LLLPLLFSLKQQIGTLGGGLEEVRLLINNIKIPELIAKLTVTLTDDLTEFKVWLQPLSSHKQQEDLDF
jgi:hypothetical protein